MPFNGSGTFEALAAPTYPAVTGATIRADYFNLVINDLMSGLSSVMTRDGQSPATANIPMGNNKLTGLAAATANGDALSWGMAQIALGLGTAAAPAYSFTGDTNTGAYSSAADTLDWTIGGTRRMTLDGSSLTLRTGSQALRIHEDGGYVAGWNTAGSTRTGYLQFSTSLGLQLVSELALPLRLFTNNTERLQVSSAGEFGVNCTPVSTVMARFQTAGSNDIGLEMARVSSSQLSLQAYDRAGAAYRSLTLQGDQINVGTSGTIRYSFGASSFFPAVTNTYNLGGSGADWQRIFARALERDTAGILELNASHASGEIDLRCAGATGLYLTSDRRVYGTALHNNAGSVTGTTNQYIASGTYTPTLTAVANVSGLGSNQAQWIRVGNVVTVSGLFSATQTSVATLCRVGVSLPIASLLTSTQQCMGAMGFEPSSGSVGNAILQGDATNDRAELRWSASGSAVAGNGSYSFTYVIV